jgi:hypothetical protein
LRVFGCPTYVRLDASLRAKFENKAWKGTFEGYAFDSPFLLVYNPDTSYVIRGMNVVFDEIWRDNIPSSPGPPLPEDDDYDDDYEVVPLLVPQVPTIEGSDVHEKDSTQLPSDVPTRTMQLELERIGRIVQLPVLAGREHRLSGRSTSTPRTALPPKSYSLLYLNPPLTVEP